MSARTGCPKGTSPSSVRTALAGSLLLALLLACGSEVPDPPNPVKGMVVAIEGGTLTLATAAGHEYVFEIADPTVPVAHLHQHREKRLPVLITWRRQGGRLLATRIADAPVG